MEKNKNYSLVYEDADSQLVLGDSLKILSLIPDNKIDVIIADLPYFLSNGGFSNSGGKVVSVNKGNWDKTDDPEKFYSTFLEEAYRILKKDGTIWVFGTMHNIYTLGYLLNKGNWKILNNITWQKSNPAPNLSRRMFTHSTETAIWAKKKHGYQTFNYDLMRSINNNKQMKDVWITSNTSRSEKMFGKHPTQKPIALIQRIIVASSQQGDLILDPFVGSGTTMVASKLLKRQSIGIDIESQYIEIAKKRITNLDKVYVGKII
ncbi:DNA-methyltransferase [Convivina praedatoris]|uniref:Methyltransferase n=1 Tax=Convivina praedatoris TaxID=2880963 RepID=A0ABM9D5E6_9LACO|nr:Modification methylase DpnIIB [Convivina sp. LMG 32447]CAH1856362.1 Modification methylase DpnIIB [Convivina sp. LMG 32447]CAH1857024.1 Modification methylase DpnIIB [Convivina sp. LMG 32447]